MNKPVDWSLRDNTLFCDIFANTKPNECILCGTTVHTTPFCPELVGDNTTSRGNFNHTNNQSRLPVPPQARTMEQRYVKSDLSDRYDRPIMYHLGRPICNNFNSVKGCSIMRCFNLHVCLNCKKQHPKTQCSFSKNFQEPNQKRYH